MVIYMLYCNTKRLYQNNNATLTYNIKSIKREKKKNVGPYPYDGYNLNH